MARTLPRLGKLASPLALAITLSLPVAAPSSAGAQTSLPDAPSALRDTTLSGTVTNAAGTLVTGAGITLSPATGPAQQTTSGPDGDFSFAHLPPGPYTLAVTLPGFVPISISGTVEPGQALTLPPLALKLATVDVQVDVTLTRQEVAQEQIRVEEKQRLIGFLPNFFVSYEWKAVPLTSRQKYGLAWKNAHDPANLALSAIVAGVEQATDAFDGYGQGAQGYGKRFGANLGDLVIGTMLGGAVLPSIFHQDPRYFYKGTGTVRSRALYAVSTAVLCRGDNGRRQPAYASILGDFSAGAISNIYYPSSDRHGAELTIENGLLGIAGDAVTGLVQEFALRHFTPSANRKILIPRAP